MCIAGVAGCASSVRTSFRCPSVSLKWRLADPGVYLQMMSPTCRAALLSLVTLLSAQSGVAQMSAAKTSAADSSARLPTTGGLSLGASGLRSGDGTTLVADVMWVGDEMMDGIGIRVIREGLQPRAHGYAAMIVIGGPPHDSITWLRIDVGLGYAGQQSDQRLRILQRHGVGALFAATVAPLRLGIIRPELNGWAVVATSARFIGASLGIRVLDPRQR